MKDRLSFSVVQSPIKDLTVAAEEIRLSWKENRKSSFDYTAEFIQSLLEYPADGPVLTPAYYDGDKLVAFVMGFPRSVRLNGEVRKLLLMTFFTVARGYKGRGLGHAIWAHCLKEAKKAGYDGTVHYCVDGELSNSVTMSAAGSAGFEMRRVFTVGFMMQSLHSSADRLHERIPASIDIFLHAASSLDAKVPLQRIWNTPEAHWQLKRPGAICAMNPNGGVLTGYIIPGSDAALTPYFFVEDILWDRLSPMQRMEILKEATQRAAQVASVAVLPILNYADLSAFRAAGFRRIPRLLHTYLTLWTKRLDRTELHSLYLDVL